ncbi:hypothetical protein HJA82_29660 [Rhizobium bangladeshense]|uniref:hypothetical protein n=1 Tax=Rhizobium bangladeshense TaxID=1138189 RepID=UPI001C82E4A2|nr:hypothetical protein [Rhizobium bangladeshense]MBX4911484.1 hypothetical protein [Rhizobium bangladeshense]
MSAIAVISNTLNTPRSSRRDDHGEAIYVPRPVTEADRQFGLYCMIAALVGMALLGAWLLFRRKS